jgi:hypothetical protein
MLNIRYLVPLKNKIGIDIPAKNISKEAAYYIWENMKNNRIDEMKGVECAG